MRKLFFLCASLLLITSHAPAAAYCDAIPTFADGKSPLRTLFVSPEGSDPSGDGSEQSPFQTIERAAQDAQPGDAIRLLPGTHAPGGFIGNLAGTADLPIWLGGAPGAERPVIAGGNQAMQLSRVRHLIVENLEITGATQNGINCDDGGDRANPDATRHVLFRNLRFTDIGSGGNQDALKLSGVDDYFVLDCEFERASAGGSGIDHVGCHDGVIAGNTFRDMGSNAIQCKGGTANLVITRNRFFNGGQRAINIGGSTGFEFFRPPLSTDAVNVEAKDIVVAANLFVGGVTPVAYVGATNCIVVNNTIVDPGNWVMRILQETTSTETHAFAPSGNNAFVNNLVYFDRSELGTFVNVGANTAPETFTFSNNLWFAHDQPAQSAPSLPVAETNPVVGVDPQLANPAGGDYTLLATSPAIGAGRTEPNIAADLAGHCYANPPAIGAREFVDPDTVDTDRDGMPDVWEELHELDPEDAADAGLDGDLDGATNLEEFIAGTDPGDPESVFRLTFTVATDQNGRVEFAAQTGRSYRLETRELASNSGWEPGTAIISPGNPAAFETVASQQPGMLFRVAVEREAE